MEYKLHSHRHALTILENEQEFREEWKEIQHIISNLDENTLRQCYIDHYQEKNKSLSTTINSLLKSKFEMYGWTSESAIFQDLDYDDPRSDYWRLDFAKDKISIEVAFNHGSATAWNLLKPVIAGELNHVSKAIQTDIGIVVVADSQLKKQGNFDNAIGYYEKYVQHLEPLRNQLSVPILIIGLEAPKTFKISPTPKNSKLKGKVIMLENYGNPLISNTEKVYENNDFKIIEDDIE